MNTSENKQNKSDFWENPEIYFENSYTRAHSLSRDELEAIQLDGLKERFNHLRDKVPYLKAVADEQSIDSIDRLEDIVRLLFIHKTYKSYPSEWLQKNQFSKLSHWINKLTIHDLDGLNSSGFKRIDDWIEGIYQHSGVMPWVSSGTSGTMTFMPHHESEMDRFARTYQMTLLQDFGDDPEEALSHDTHEIWPFYRYPGGGMNMDFDLRIKYMLGGDEDRFHALFPSTSSLDIRYLQTQMRLSKSEQWDKMDFPEDLIKETQEFEEKQKTLPSQLGGFLTQCAEQLKGKQIVMLGTWPMMYNMAQLGLAAGQENIFSENSRILAGGGRKGTVLPDNWQDDVLRFTGVKKLGGLYGMTEVLARHMACEHGHIHLAPWVISMLLDPDTSQLLPREGRQTGRYAFYDLAADSHWGGLVTGDKLSIEWSEPCACGQTSPYIVGEISRYAEERGGVDDFPPTAPLSAHNNALEFLIDLNS